MKNIELGQEAITWPKGFQASACAAGIKPGRDDMALIYCTQSASAAIVTTTNKVKAAPVTWDQEIYAMTPYKRACVINAGNANACTGEQGLEDAKKTADLAASLLELSPDEVFVSSTGIIGVPLPMDLILGGVEKLCRTLSDSNEAGDQASQAILTTDTKPKRASIEIEIDGKPVRIAAMCKGSGMIRPNMATMLAYTTTDADIEPELLQKMLAAAARDSFNMISVDGDMSTNDTAIVLASGLSGVKVGSVTTPQGRAFYEALKAVEVDLAKQIASDGEGATKRLEVTVNGAKTREDARVLSRSVVESPLVKTAMFGEDANWGRILCALGYANAEFDPDRAKLAISSEKGSMDLFKDGMPLGFSEEKASEILSEPVIVIDVDAGLGDETATCWGCDLSYDYVRINGDYRT